MVRKIIAITWFFLVYALLNSVYAQSRHASNVLFSNRPLPVYAGIEIGTGLSTWLNGTPTYFTTTYPYSATPDTLHLRFPSGAGPLFGFFLGVSGDFALGKNWGLIGKFNYNERRGNWNTVNQTECELANGNVAMVPVTSDINWMVRAASAELLARYVFPKIHDFYLGAGLSLSAILNDHYDLTQTIDGPADCTFRDFTTGQPTGIQRYGIGGQSPGLNRFFGEFKALAGMPFHVGYRWVISPEVTLGVPVTDLFTSDKRAEYRANGISSTPRPLTVTGLVAFRYQLQ